MKPYPFFLVLCLLFASLPAQGRDLAAAEVLFQKGRAAMEARDYEAACASFAESYRLDPAVGTAMNLAVCKEKIGLLANSWEHWQHALQALSPDDRRRQFVEDRIAALEAVLPKLTIFVKANDPQSVELERNGIPLGQAAWGLAVPVDPGVHEVVVRSVGHWPRTYRIEVSKGEAKTLEVTTGPELPEPTPERSRVDSMRTWGYIAGGVGLAGLGSALATGFMLQGTKDTVDENCTDRECNAEGMKAVGRGKTQLALNTTGFIIAGVGLGTGATLLLWTSGSEKRNHKRASRERKTGSRASLRVLGSGVALTYGGTF